MDLNFNTTQTEQKPQRISDSFANASLILGVIAALLCITGILPLFFGSLSILFAILSTRKGMKPAGNAKAGFVLSLIGIALGGYFTISSLYTLFTDPATFAQYNALYEQLYGESLNDIFGIPGSNSQQQAPAPQTQQPVPKNSNSFELTL